MGWILRIEYAQAGIEFDSLITPKDVTHVENSWNVDDLLLVELSRIHYVFAGVSCWAHLTSDHFKILIHASFDRYEDGISRRFYGVPDETSHRANLRFLVLAYMYHKGILKDIDSQIVKVKRYDDCRFTISTFEFYEEILDRDNILRMGEERIEIKQKPKLSVVVDNTKG